MPFIHSQRSLPVLGGFGFYNGKLVGRGKLPFEQSRSGKPAVRCTKNLGMSGTIGLPHPLFFGKRGFRLLERQARGAG